MNQVNSATRPSLVVLTGAGISAESGLGVFRGSGGLWENFRIEEVASIEGWHADPAKVLMFYNLRRRQAEKAQPNAGHLALVALEKDFDVTVITQNVDDLHERAGSSKVIHLHGMLSQGRSQIDDRQICDLTGKSIELGDTCELGGQLRPNIVWFGEMVPMYDQARVIVQQADKLLIVGTSLQVYPAAGLLYERQAHAETVLVDPNEVEIHEGGGTIEVIRASATQGLPALAARWMS